MDDEPMLRRLFRRMLERDGFEVVEVADGVSALNLIREGGVDVVVSDVRMPLLSGLELLHAVVHDHPELPVILVSGSSDVADKQGAAELGAFDFLRKPIDIPELGEVAARAVAWGRARANTTERSERSASPADDGGGTILLVDDYQDARAGVREALEEAGHRVIEAGNGQEALNLLVSQPRSPVKLILLDLVMPVMDGWKFLELLKSYIRLSTIPVLVVSANARQLRLDVHDRIVGAIQVPYDLKHLLRMVSRCVSPLRTTAPA